jgi:hypothetical protein
MFHPALQECHCSLSRNDGGSTADVLQFRNGQGEYREFKAIRVVHFGIDK